MYKNESQYRTGCVLRDILFLNLSDKEIEVIHSRFGLTRKRKTLSTIGSIYGISRERVRQIEERAIKKIYSDFADNNQIQQIFYKVRLLAKKITPLDAIDNLSNIYINEGVVRLLLRIEKEDFCIFEDDNLIKSFLIQKKERSKIDKLLNKLIECLNYQKSYVPIKEFVDHFNICEEFILSIEKLEVNNGSIVIRTNKNIFNISLRDRVKDVLEKYGKPMHIKDISEKSGIKLSRILGRSGQLSGIINVGKSIYALKEWGYIKGTTADIICYYLNNEGIPMHYLKIVRLIKKQKQYKTSTVYAALQNDDRIQNIDNSMYALKEWGYESKHEPRVLKYKVSNQEAILSVMDIGKYITRRDIINKIKNKYHDSASIKFPTTYMNLNKLNKKGKIEILKKEFVNYYKLINR